MAFNLKDDPRLMQRLQGAAGLLSPKDIDAPPAELPPLESIEVVVPVPPGPSEDQILARYRDKLRELAVVTRRAAGDELQLGDEVCLNIVGYANGALVPGSIRFEHWTEMFPDPSLPGFIEALLGAPVGGATVVPVILPADFVEPAFRKKPAAFTVHVVDAQAVEMPHPEASETIKKLGLGKDLDATLAAVAAELAREAEQSTPLRAMSMAMNELARVAVVDVPQKGVDAEIQRAWKAAEGDHATALGLSVEEQQEALKLWLTDPAVRAEATLRLKNFAALKTVVERDRLTLDEAAWDHFFATFAPTLGQPAAALRAEVEKDERMRAELEETAFRMHVVEHVLKHVKMRIDE